MRLDLDKLEILQELDALIVARLFGHAPWLTDPETAIALQKMLMQMRLEEKISLWGH